MYKEKEANHRLTCFEIDMVRFRVIKWTLISYRKNISKKSNYLRYETSWISTCRNKIWSTWIYSWRFYKGLSFKEEFSSKDKKSEARKKEKKNTNLTQMFVTRSSTCTAEVQSPILIPCWTSKRNCSCQWLNSPKRKQKYDPIHCWLVSKHLQTIEFCNKEVNNSQTIDSSWVC